MLLGKLAGQGFDLLNDSFKDEPTWAAEVGPADQAFRFLTSKPSIKDSEAQFAQSLANQSSEIIDNLVVILAT